MNNFLLVVSVIVFLSCNNTNTGSSDEKPEEFVENTDTIVYPGIYDTNAYFDLLEDKNVAVVGNHTSLIGEIHLVDTLINSGINVVKVFCPEHGFRGDADAGATIDDSTDPTTGLPIVSLYGKNKKPYDDQLNGIEIVVFDLQDVGTRFYTYISTLHYVMEACAENKIPVIVLDRPNPNIHYVDGPVLDTANNRSFIGMHPVPVVYGMSIGEYALMINGEKWLSNQINCNLKVINCKNYSRSKKYSLPIPPSPNLPNDRSIELYPTLCFFESTNLSIGRGTNKQFQIIGHPDFSVVDIASFTFTPQPNRGASDPKLNGELCYGFDLSESYSIFNWQSDKLNIGLIIEVFNIFPDKDNFFKKSNSIELVSGSSVFRSQIENQVSEQEIRDSWEPQLSEFKKIRSKYLIYE